MSEAKEKLKEFEDLVNKSGNPKLIESAICIISLITAGAELVDEKDEEIKDLKAKAGNNERDDCGNCSHRTMCIFSPHHSKKIGFKKCLHFNSCYSNSVSDVSKLFKKLNGNCDGCKPSSYSCDGCIRVSELKDNYRS